MYSVQEKVENRTDCFNYAIDHDRQLIVITRLFTKLPRPGESERDLTVYESTCPSACLVFTTDGGGVTCPFTLLC